MNPLDEKISQAETGVSSSSIKDVIVDEPAPEESPASSSRSSWWASHGWVKWAVLGTVSVGAIATAIGVPLALKDDDDSGKTKFEPVVNYTPPFEEKGIPILSDDVLEGYTSVEDFEKALEEVAKSYLNGVIGNTLQAPGYTRFGMGDDIALEAAADSVDANRASPTAQAGSQKYDGVNDYNVNDQEVGVNEGDRVVTDGNVTVAAYGEYLVGWRNNGTMLLKMKLEDVSAADTNGYYPKPYIHTLLLKGDSLIVAAGNYGYHAQQIRPRVLSAFENTRFLIYNMSSIGKNMNALDLIARRDINGNFVSLRAIGDAIHFVTSTELNWYRFLFSPFTRYGNSAFASLDADSYPQEVRRTATTKNIPEFINQTVEEILECGALPRLVRLNRWTTNNESDPTMEHFLYDYGYARSMVMVFSFNLTQVEQEGPSSLECLDVSGAFFPSASWNTKFYSAKDTMIMAVQGYDYSVAREMSIDSTYLVAYDIDGARTRPKSLGFVEGYVLNPYSFRVEGSILEIATTIRQAWRWIMVADVGPRRLQTNVPLTENYILTMNLSGVNGTIQEIDRLAFGKEGEVFTTVRFYENKVTSENIGYAVTFRQMDPFYAFNTTDPHNINITGELDNITGWSSYLEPINDAISVMLAVGQEASDQGRPLGVSISVFDATDLSNVHVADKLLIESNTEVWSDSEGLRDKNAVRFNQETGLLILPLRLYGNGDSYFRGFRLFTVTETLITENKACMVDHSNSIDRYSYSPRSLEPRSMIIDGSYMSTMGDQVLMMDLGTCTVDWRLTV